MSTSICLDASGISNGYCGYNTYAELLLGELLPLLREQRVSVLLRADLRAGEPLRQVLARHPEVQQQEIAGLPVLGPGRDWWDWRQRGHLARAGVQLYHCLHSNPLRHTGAWQVATLHDLSALALPGYFARGGWLKRPYLRWAYAGSLGACERVICVSQHTARDAERLLGLPTARLRVIPEAGRPAGPTLVKGPPAAGVAPMFLTVGTRAHKNLPRVMRAFTKVVERHPGVSLRICGAVTGELQATHRALPPAARAAISLQGVVPEAQLQGWYRECQALLYLSLYEGFGLPVLEAMAMGTPVIAANNSSLPEVAGQAALLVDPLSEDAIRMAIESLLDEPERRGRLILAGQMQAAKFSWAKTAQATLAVYRECPAWA